ncbi:MAG: hypothetical protein Tp1100SUR639781_52 [Prokaryotic dsDNA virus sp.]|nr:MAG: hypothetical protein Tp1100SUR639781_52 [Prokaryotic dsDNA virus sp.]
MINSISKKDWNAFEDEFFVELDCYVGKKFTSENPEFEHIGWCVSDSIYVIVMSEHELFELKGISIDTREKSQAESKKNFKGT